VIAAVFTNTVERNAGVPPAEQGASSLRAGGGDAACSAGEDAGVP